MNVVMMRMMAETTMSSISVTPPGLGVFGEAGPLEEERRKCLKYINIEKESERRSRYEEGGEGHLALHCIPPHQLLRSWCGGKSPFNKYEPDAHSGAYPKREHKSGKTGRNTEQPPQPQLKRAVAPAHPPAAGNSGDKKKRER